MRPPVPRARPSFRRMMVVPVATLLASWLLSCQRDFDNPLDPGSPLSPADSALVAGLGMALEEFLQEHAPDCRGLARACLDTALANHRLGLGRHPRILALASDRSRLRTGDTLRLAAEAIGLYPIRGYAWSRGAEAPFSDTTPVGAFRIAFADSGVRTVRVKALAEGEGTFASPESALAVSVIRDVPVAVILGDSAARVGDSLRFLGRGLQEFGHIVHFKWSDGQAPGGWTDSSADSGAVFAYVARGEYEVRLHVRDDIGNADSTRHIVRIANDDPVFVTGLRDTVLSALDTVHVRVQASDPDGIRWYLWDWGSDGEFEDTTRDGSHRRAFPPGNRTLSLSVWAADRFDGRTRSQARVQLIADIPGTPVFGPVFSPTNNRRPAWTWSSGGGGSKEFRVKLDDPEWGEGALVLPSGTTVFVPDQDLSEGAHTLCVQERNAAGNWSLGACRAIVVDWTPPNAPLVAGPPSPTNDLSPEWTWVSGGGGGEGFFRFRWGSDAWFTTTYEKRFAITLSEGEYTFQVQERDSAGNWSASGMASVSIRTTPPNPPVFAAGIPSLTRDPRPSWAWSSGGRGGAGVFDIRLYRSGDSTRLAAEDTLADTLYAPRSDLADGRYFLEVRERDTVGNWSDASLSWVTVKSTPPGAPVVTTSPPSPTNIARPTWLWTSGGGGNGNFRIRLNDSDLTTGSQSTVARDFTPGTDLPDGAHTLYVQEADSAGNWSAAGRAVLHLEKARANAPAVTVHPASPTINTRPTWSWTGGGGTVTYRYRLDDTGMAAATVTAQTSFSPAWDLGPGPHTLHVQARDGAGNWSFTGSREAVIVQSGATASAHVGWVVGSDGMIRKSTNGGASWFAQNSGTVNALAAIHFLDANTGWIVGANGTILKTTNGGTNWISQNSGTTQYLSAIIFVDADIGWAAGAGSTIVKTSNGGATWVVQNSAPPSLSLNALHFANANTGWAVGTNGVVLKTVNGGATWISQSSGSSQRLNSVYFSDSNTGWIAGDAGTLLKTTTGGASWIPQTSGTTRPLRSVHFTSQHTGWAAGGELNTGVLLNTTDGGASWRSQQTDASYYFTSIMFADAATGWAVVYNGSILKSNDGGSTWLAQSANANFPAYSACFLNLTNATPPSPPLVFAASDTSSPRPLWTWTSGGGGAGIYRYKLDDPDLGTGAVQTTYARFIPPSDLGEGPHTLHVQEAGDGGTWSASGGATVYVDWTPPNPPAITGPVSPTNNPRPTWTWVGGGGGNGTYRYKFNDSNLTQGATVTGTARFTPGGDLAEGAHALYVQERDAAGNWSPSARASTVIDRTSPNMPIVSAEAKSSSPRPSWTWTSGGNGGAGVYRFKLDDTLLNAGAIPVAASSFTPSTDQSPGFHTLYVQERDSAGNWSAPGKFRVRVFGQTGYAVGATILKSIDAGGTWSWSGGGIFHSVRFTNANIGYAVGGSGVAVKTTDGGQNWTVLSNGTAETLKSVYFVGHDTGYAVGDGGVFIKTVDGGRSWTNPVRITDTYLECVHFPNANVGYATGFHSGILKTTDGGSTWSQVVSSAQYNLMSIYFVNPEHGYAAGNDGVILRTRDGGVTWSLLGDGSNWFFSIFFVSESIGFAVGDGGIIVKSVDGGETWSTVSDGMSLQLYSVFFIDANTGWAAGYGGTILKTVDGGNTWFYAAPVPTIRLNSIHFADSNTGYAVGYNGTIAKTTDGGNSWSTQVSIASPSHFYSAFFVDAQTGYAAGNRGIAKTINTGQSWVPIYTGAPLYSICFINADTGYAAGANGTILKTGDRGGAWSSLASGSSSEFRAVTFPNPGIGFAAGSAGTIVKTINAGASWFPLASGTISDLRSLYFLDSALGYAAGSDGTILRTRNGGNTWSVLNGGTSEHIYTIYFVDANIGYAAGRFGTLIKTEDGGDTWRSLPSGVAGHINSLFFTSPRMGYAAGTFNSIIRTTDGGVSWTAPVGSSMWMESVVFP